MNMRRISRTINNTRGATVVIALFGFMAAAMASIVIINAAYANSRQTADLKNAEQAYLTASSAAGIVRTAICGNGDGDFSATQKYIVGNAKLNGSNEEQRVYWGYGSSRWNSPKEYSESTDVFSDPDLSVQLVEKDESSGVVKEIREAVQALFDETTGAGEEKIVLSITDDGVKTSAQIRLVMDPKTKMITCTIKSCGEGAYDEDKATYAMILNFPASVKNGSEITSESLELTDESTSVSTHKITTRYYEWTEEQMSGRSVRKSEDN